MRVTLLSNLLGQIKLQFLGANNIDHNSSIEAETRVVRGQLGNTIQQPTTILKDVGFAGLPTKFRRGNGAT